MNLFAEFLNRLHNVAKYDVDRDGKTGTHITLNGYINDVAAQRWAKEWVSKIPMINRSFIIHYWTANLAAAESIYDELHKVVDQQTTLAEAVAKLELMGHDNVNLPWTVTDVMVKLGVPRRYK